MLIRLIFFVVLSVGFCNKIQAQTVVSFTDAAEKVLPSVVSVSVIQTTAEPPEMVLALRGSPFEEFFKDAYKDGGFEEPKSILLGSGFVYDNKGHIITNAHVISEMQTVTLTLNDGQALQAKVIGKDLKTDLAVLKVADSNLLPVVVGNSDGIKVGEPVMAVGNPFGLGNSVTTGIISARSRDIQVGPYDDFLQTDAAINKGNSGGPLFNAAGKMIGVNTAIFSPSGGSVGIAFALPSKIVQSVADSIIQDGFVKRGRLGLNVQSVSETVAKNAGLKTAKGAVVASVDKSSNAKNSKVKAGDIILKFQGIEILNMRDLPRLAAMEKPNTIIKLDVLRLGKIIEIPLMLSELKDEQRKQILPTDSLQNSNTKLIDFLGVEVAEITPNMRQKYNLDKGVFGLVVTNVNNRTDAFAKGLKSGDVIVELDKKSIDSFKALNDWENEVAEMGQESSFVLISRHGNRFFAVIKFSKID